MNANRFDRCRPSKPAPRFGIEQVDGFGRDPDADRIARTADEARRQPRLELATRHVEDHQRIGAERLDHARDPAERCVGPADPLQILGPNDKLLWIGFSETFLTPEDTPTIVR